MSVFLRWGIFGILAVAALIYAYNASKNMAGKRTAQQATVNEAAPVQPVSEPGAEREPESPAYATPPHCEAELVVAQRALAARREGEPLDRLLRIQEIAFQEQPRRGRLEKVATSWYQLEGDEPIPEALRIGVITDCMRFSPAP